MPVNLPIDWSPITTERVRPVRIKTPNLFLMFMLIVYALCFLAMIDAFQHKVIYTFDLAPG